MKAPWEYLENLNKNVYAVDICNHTLVYMNRYAREQFQQPDDKSYVGQKCYALLQGLPGPCPVCASHELEEGQFYEWSYYNKLLGKSYLLTDTVVEYEGRLYRLEIAEGLETDSDGQIRNSIRYFESVINTCMVQTYATTDPSEALGLILDCLGERFGCTRIDLYEEREPDRLFQTCRWPANGTESGEGVVSALELPFQLFREHRSLVVSDQETFRQERPELFTFLAPKEGDMTLLVPLFRGEEWKGCLRLDAPGFQEAGYVSESCKVLSYFIVSLMERRDMMEHLRELSYHDQLTGAFNRYALDEYVQKGALAEPTGVIYCDINNLKRMNDQMGHGYGDHLIRQSYKVLTDIQGKKKIYRIGGDEFLVICEGLGEEAFHQRVEALNASIMEKGCTLTVGSAWGAAGEEVAALQERAETQMYQEKRTFYDRQANEQVYRMAGLHMKEQGILTPLENYIRTCYFDVELSLQSIAMANPDTYFCCGDIQKNMYFISENLKEEFGFSDNLVSNFISELQKRIYEGDRQLYIDDIHSMLERHKATHDLRCRIYNKSGEPVWVHCRGLVKWDESSGKPVFFAGNMTGLKRDAEVDNVTGMLSLSGAFRQITERCREGHYQVFLCFTLTNFTDINQAYGHVTANQILWELGCELKRQMGMEDIFIRMDGLRFLVLLARNADPGEAARRIRQIVTSVYERRGIRIIYPCAIGVVRYPKDGSSIQELIDNAVVVIRAAKEEPEREYVAFSRSMLGSRQSANEINLRLNASVSNHFKGFRIVVQPQVYADSGKIYGGEVLLRWEDDQVAVPPSVFIPILEQMGLIVSVGKWIIQQTVQLCKRILPDHPDFKLSFNVSYLQVIDQRLFPFLRRMLAETGVPGKNLMIELTESHSDTLPKQLEQFIEQCKGLGLSFALDDFGSGYSGVQRLLQYPVDLVKFDRALVGEMSTSQQKLDFIVSTIHTCHEFKKKVCMEGVERKEEWDLIRKTECDFIQGYYFYHPLELDEFYQVLEEKGKGTEG